MHRHVNSHRGFTRGKPAKASAPASYLRPYRQSLNLRDGGLMKVKI